MMGLVPRIKFSVFLALLVSGVVTSLPTPAHSSDSDDARLILTERHNAAVLKLKHVMTLLECRQEAQPKDLIGRFFLPKTERRGTAVRKAAFAQANAAVPLLEFAQWKISGDWSELGEKERIESLQEARKNLEEAEAHLKLAQTSWFRYEKDVVTTASIRAGLVSCVKQKNSEFTTLMEAQESALTTAVEAAGLVEEPKANRPVSLSLPPQAKRSEKNPKEVSPKKKKQQDAVEKKAASVLAQWKVLKGKVPPGFDLMQFSMEADAAFTDESLPAAERAEILRGYANNLSRYKNNGTKLKNDSEKIDQAIEDLYTDYIHHYEPNNGQVKDLLSGKGGNCDTRSITLFHALAQKLKLNPGPDSRYAAQIFNKHIQLVIYSKDPKTGKEEVRDLLTGKKTNEIKGPLYDPMVMVQGVLLANKQPSPVKFEDFYIAGPKPLPGSSGAPPEGPALATNSSRAYPLVGVTFGGSTDPNPHSLSPRQSEAIREFEEKGGASGALGSGSVERISINTGIMLSFSRYSGKERTETKSEIRNILLKRDSSSLSYSNLKWHADSDGLTFYDPVTRASFATLKTADERLDFLVDLDVQRFRRVLDSADYKKFISYWANPLRGQISEVDIIAQYYVMEDLLSGPSFGHSNEMYRQKLSKRLGDEGLGDQLDQGIVLVNRGLERVRKSPLSYLSVLSKGLAADPNSVQHLRIPAFLSLLSWRDIRNSVIFGSDYRIGSPLSGFYAERDVFVNPVLQDEVVFKRNPKAFEALKKEKVTPWYLKAEKSVTVPPPKKEMEESGIAKKQDTKVIELDISFILPVLDQLESIIYREYESAGGISGDKKYFKDLERFIKKWTPEVSEGILEFVQLQMKGDWLAHRGSLFNREICLLYQVFPHLAATRDPATLKYPGVKAALPEDLALLSYGLLSLPRANYCWGKDAGFTQEYANRLADALGKPRIKMP